MPGFLPRGRLEPTTEVEFKTIDGMFIKGIRLPKKGLYPQHSHQFDHSSLLARGSVILWKGNEEAIHYEAPAIILIQKGLLHKFQTLEDETLIYCLHNLHFGEAPAVLQRHSLELELEDGA